MRKTRKVVPITQGQQRTPPSARTFLHEEYRLLTCRQTQDSFSFHLGPPLFRSRAVHHQPGKILPFPARRLACEASDAGLLSPELAASIRRVKGPKKLGVRLGNWLTADEARRFWQSPDPDTLKGKRDLAILAILLGCGLRRRELTDLEFTHLRQRKEHWAIVDLVGKGGHIRTVPVPDWVKATVDEWIRAADLHSGRIFRCVCRAGKWWGDGITERVVWHVVKLYAARTGLAGLALTT